jgi:hypothetical protein
MKIDSRTDRGQMDAKMIVDLRSKESENDEVRGAIR